MVELVERDAEVRQIEQALRRCVAGRGGTVVINASPGLGKTALLRRAERLATDAGIRVLRARAADLERDFAFGVVRQLFERVLAVPEDRAGLLAGAAAAAGALFHATEWPDSREHAAGPWARSLFPVLNGLYWLLVNLTEGSPTVLIVDDAHWADMPSLRFLGFLSRRLDTLPVAVMIATRPDERDDPEPLNDVLVGDGVVLLEPKQLSPAAVASQVRQRLGGEADDEFCAACHAATAGNPLFVRELLRALAADGVAPRDASSAVVQAAGAGAVRHHVVARLQRQPETAQRVARAVAVLGDNTEVGLVARQAGLHIDETAGAVDTLVRHGFFEHRSPPRFVHALVRDAVLALIAPAARGAEHDRAAAVLAEAGAPAERVASHVLRTVGSGAPERLTVLLQAADEVRRRGSPESAVVYLTRAMREPPPPALRSEVSRLLGNCHAYRLAFDQADVHLREALTLAATPRQRGLAAFSLARFRNACQEPGEAVDILLRAAADLPVDQEPELAARVEAELVGFARVDLARRDLLVQRLEAYQRVPHRIPEVVDAHLSLEAVNEGQPAAAATALARSALTGTRLPPDKSGLWMAIQTLLVADRLDEAERHLNSACEFALQRGMLVSVALARAYLARVALLRGDLAQARTHVEAGTRAACGPHFALPMLHSTLVHLLVEEDRLAEADTVVASGVLAGGQPPTTSMQLWLLDARARLRWAQGDAAVALADAERCGELYHAWGAQRMPDVPWRLRAARVLTGHGSSRDAQSAAELVAEELRVAEAFTVPRHIALAKRAAARLAGDAEARRLVEQAVELLGDSPARLELAHALEHLGRLLLRGGDRAASRRTLRRAAELALECHAEAMATRLRARLSAGGGRPARLHISGLPALTPSERQVAQLAAGRLSNRQIAERLFVTEKTVEAHLSRAYRKLRVESRVELAERLATAGPEPRRR